MPQRGHGTADAVLVMEDSDGARSYFHLPGDWLAWLDGTSGPPPADLVAAYEEDHGTFPAGKMLDFAVRTRQIVACDRHWIGTSLREVARHLAGRDLREVHGTWY